MDQHIEANGTQYERFDPKVDQLAHGVSPCGSLTAGPATAREIRIRQPRVAIVGAGLVGATTAYGLMLSDSPADLILVNRSKELAEGHADDIRDAQIFSHVSRISVGSLSDCHDADIVVITVGCSQSRLKTSRLEDLKGSAAIFSELIPQIAAANPSAILVIASNPVDVMTYAALRLSGLPSSRVLGSGTTLDTSRLRRRLGELYEVAPTNVHAYVVGEHGESQVALLESARIAGVPLADFCRLEKRPDPERALQKVADDARAGGVQILRAKGATYYGIAAALVKIVRSILRNEHAVLTVSSLIPASLGMGEVCLSLPSVIDRSGVGRVIVPRLSPKEERALKESAEAVKRHIAAIC